MQQFMKTDDAFAVAVRIHININKMLFLIIQIYKNIKYKSRRKVFAVCAERQDPGRTRGLTVAAIIAMCMPGVLSQPPPPGRQNTPPSF